MISYTEALIRLAEAAQGRILTTEKISLASSCGRISSEKVSSPEPLPAFDNSSMDGFAVKASQTQAASPEKPLRLKVLGQVAAGDCPPLGPKRSGAFEINTGAALPRNLDAVIKIEDVLVLNGGKAIELVSPAQPGNFIRRSGEDFPAGTPILEDGDPIEEGHILALAALGLSRVLVRKKPKLALISTGRELTETQTKPKPGQIRNASATYLMASLDKAQAQVIFHGTVPDDPAHFINLMEKLLADRPDIILTTGAVSMGRHDFIPSSLQELGAKPLFHKVSIKPAKPLLAADFPGGPLFLGLPGNPVSTAVGLRFFVQPYLRLIRAQAPEQPLRARLSAPVSKPEGLLCFFKSLLSLGSQGPTIRILPGQASFMIRPLTKANAWAVLPEKGDFLAAGAEIEAFALQPDSWSLSPSRAGKPPAWLRASKECPA
jgi:molybdopterin molybdotransferase